MTRASIELSSHRAGSTGNSGRTGDIRSVHLGIRDEHTYMDKFLQLHCMSGIGPHFHIPINAWYLNLIPSGRGLEGMTMRTGFTLTCVYEWKG